jgi:HlyD family secretion protein
MNAKMYRKAALERLASPEDLDRMLTVTSARQWLVLTGLLVFVVTAAGWSFVARLPTKAAGEGILIGQGGVVNVVTTGAGTITDFKAKIGDRIHAGQVVATIAQPEILTSIRQTQNRLEEARVDAGRTTHLQDESTRLQIAALDRQRVTVEGDIKQGTDLVKLAQEQIPVEQRLLEQGLQTKQQLIAAQQRVVELQSGVEKNKAQLVAIDAERYGLKTQPEITRRDAQLRVEELERQVQTLDQQMKLSTQVISPFDGVVVELKVYEGSAAVAGTPVLSLQPAIGQLEVVAFVPTSEAKRILPGMVAQVSPSTVKREEYGYLHGRVTYVSDFPTTDAAAMRTFENASLVNTLKSQGVANEVRVVLERAENTSGYAWSSKKSPNQVISSGTLCSIQVVTRERRPIELVMPFLKSFFNPE